MPNHVHVLIMLEWLHFFLFCIQSMYMYFCVYRFRRQYEQLQAVIVRVLRPATPTSGSSQQVGAASPIPDQGESSMETDDMSAVREVRLAYENVKIVDCLDLTPEGNASWEAALKRYVHVYIYTCMYTHCIFYCLASNLLYMYLQVRNLILMYLASLLGSYQSLNVAR